MRSNSVPRSDGPVDGLRFCRKCREWLPVDRFFRQSPGRLRNQCKTCDNARLQRYRAARRERVPDPRYMENWPPGHVPDWVLTKRAQGKLTQARVDEMRALYESGMKPKDLVRRFPEVSRSMVEKVVYFKAWR